MKATIWHNPACSTSRTTLTTLQSHPDLDLTIVEYLKTPPSRDELVALFATAAMTPRDGLRTHAEPAATLFAELGLADAGDDAILDAMMTHPILINRPLVRTDKGVRLCRPPERVLEIL